MISTVITDDEVLARHRLGQLLRAQPGIRVVGEASSAAEAIELVKLTKPQLLFLDIQMPDMDGFDALAAMSKDGDGPLPRIIFTTAYDKYAIRAFDIHAVDYLLKPYTKERFHEALSRAREQLERGDVAQPSVAVGAKQHSERIVFKSGGRVIFLPLSEICWIASEQNYIRLHTNKENYMLRETIGSFEERIDPKQFLRIHRSTIINLSSVKEMRTDSAHGDFTVVLNTGQQLAISRKYRSRIAELIKG